MSGNSKNRQWQYAPGFTFNPKFAPGLFFDTPSEGGEGSGQPNAGGNGGRTFTQEQVDVLVGNARKDGRESALTKLLKDLGVDDAENLKKLVTTARTAEDANKSELQKLTDSLAQAQKKAADAETDAEKQITAIKNRLMISEIKISASRTLTDKEGKVIRPAFRAEALDDLDKFIDRSLITEKDGVYSGIEKALDELAKAKPFLLADAGATGEKSKGSPNPQKKQPEKPQNKQEQRPAQSRSILS